MKKNKISSVILKSGLCVPFLLALPLSSCSLYTSTKYFAELVVSENTSVLKDNSFSQSAYEGWYNFMNRINPDTGKKDSNNNTYNYFGDPATYQLSEDVNMPNIKEEHPDFHLAKGIWRRPGLITENTFRWIFDGGANAIIASGFNLAPSIEAIAPKFPDKGFFLIDSWVDKSLKLDNVAAIKFAAEQSGYLSGIAAGEFLKVNKDIFGKDGSLKAGGFVGVAFPTTMDFLAGFQMGLLEYNINQNNSEDKVEWINLGQNIDSYSSGSFSPGGATTISKTLIEKGADIIITIAGPQVTDTIAAIESNVYNRPIAMVGVDTPKELNNSINKSMKKLLNGNNLKDAEGKVIDDPKIIQFSAVKKIDQALYSMLAAVFNKNDPNNVKKITELINPQNTAITPKQFPNGGFGYANIGSYSNKSTGVSERGLKYIKKYNPSWVKSEDNKDLFVPRPTPNSNLSNNVSVYEKSTYKLLQKGHFFRDINMKNITETDITNFMTNSSSDKLIPMNNRGSLQFFEPLKDESAQPQYFGTEAKNSLNGSVWSLYKNGNNLKKEILYNRKEEK